MQRLTRGCADSRTFINACKLHRHACIQVHEHKHMSVPLSLHLCRFLFSLLSRITANNKSTSPFFWSIRPFNCATVKTWPSYVLYTVIWDVVKPFRHFCKGFLESFIVLKLSVFSSQTLQPRSLSDPDPLLSVHMKLVRPDIIVNQVMFSYSFLWLLTPKPGCNLLQGTRLK